MESPVYHPHSYVERQISRKGFWHYRTISTKFSALLLAVPLLPLKHDREQSSVPRVLQTFERESEKGWQWPRVQKRQSNLATGSSGRCLRQQKPDLRPLPGHAGERRGQRARTLFEARLCLYGVKAWLSKFD